MYKFQNSYPVRFNLLIFRFFSNPAYSGAVVSDLMTNSSEKFIKPHPTNPDTSGLAQSRDLTAQNTMATLGAAIYGQLVTADQLSQLEQQNAAAASAACDDPKADDTSKLLINLVKKRLSMCKPEDESKTADCVTLSSPIYTMTQSAYANLDPSYTPKRDPSHQPMDVMADSFANTTQLTDYSVGQSTAMDVGGYVEASAYRVPGRTGLTSPHTNCPCSPLPTDVCAKGKAVLESKPIAGSVIQSDCLARDHDQRPLMKMSVNLIRTYKNINEVSNAQCVCVVCVPSLFSHFSV